MKLACILFVVITTALASAQHLSQFDLSTDAGVNAAREALAGKKLDEHSKNCIQRSRNLPGIVAVGDFAFDRGCRLEGVFVNSNYFTAEDNGLSKTALESLGWKWAKATDRRKLALSWVEDGLLGFLTVVSKKNEDFDGRPYQEPRIHMADGTMVVTLWIRLPPGHLPGITYELREFRFSPSGDLAGAFTHDTFTTKRN